MSNIDKNRSLFALAAQRSLGQNLSLANNSKILPKQQQQTPSKKPNPPTSTIFSPSPSPNPNPQKQLDPATRKLMIKLTLPRLRKMQALVRGFLCRRKVYPPKLEEYLVAKSILNLIVANVIYREASQIILENVTYLKYEPDREGALVGYEKMLENQVCNRILERVFMKEIKGIVELATSQYARLLTRPRITYGFNLRDPLELLLYDTINNFFGTNYKQIVRQAIQQIVDQNRQLQLIDQWITQYNMLQSLYQQIVHESLNESIGEYLVENLLHRICREGAEVVARVGMDEQIEGRKERAYGDVERKMVEYMLQEAAVRAVVGLGFGGLGDGGR